MLSNYSLILILIYIHHSEIHAQESSNDSLVQQGHFPFVFAAVNCHSGRELHHSDVTALLAGYAG